MAASKPPPANSRPARQLIAMQQTCDVWSSDILEAARLSANALNRPWGPSAPTPDQRWQGRSPITVVRRAGLRCLVDRKTTDITESTQRERRQNRPPRTTSPRHARRLSPAPRSAKPLVELGILFVRRPASMSTEFNADFMQKLAERHNGSTALGGPHLRPARCQLRCDGIW